MIIEIILSNKDDHNTDGKDDSDSKAGSKAI